LDDELPQVPSWTFAAGVEYNNAFPSPIADDGKFVFRADYSYKDGFFHNSQNSVFNFQPSYDLFNLRAGYGPAVGKWQISAYALNVLDEEYLIFREDLLAFLMVTTIPAAPREAGVELSFKW